MRVSIGETADRSGATTSETARAAHIGHSRDARRLNAGPRHCARLVTSDGITSSAAAAAGVIHSASRLTETVGNPMPVTPLTRPARAKTAATSRASTAPPAKKASMREA